MPRTLLAFFASLVLMLVAFSLPKDHKPKHLFLPVDFEGVRVVEVVAPGNPSVLITSTTAPGVDYLPQEGKEVTTRRTGDRLVVESTHEYYREMTVFLPPTVQMLVVREAWVDAAQRVDTLTIDVGRRLKWEGDAGRLVLRHTLPPPRGEEPAAPGLERPVCDSSCRGWIAVESGRIEHLEASSLYGHVGLPRSDDVAHARLRLGADATFSVGNATRLDNIHLEAIDAPAVSPAEPENPQP